MEKEFGLECCPANWPIGEGESFQGVLDRASGKVHLFQKGNRKKKVSANVIDVNDPELIEVIGEALYSQLLDDIDMLEGLITPPDIDRIQVSLIITI